MNIRDYFKNSVWESFMDGQGLTADFMTKAVIAMLLAVILGIFIYKIYGHYFGGVVFSSSFAVTLVGMTVLSCMLTLAISSNIVISLVWSVRCLSSGIVLRSRIPWIFCICSGLFLWESRWEPDCMCWRLLRCLLWWL